MNDAIDTRVTMTAEESNRQVRLDEQLIQWKIKLPLK